jgi:hypothetical protein
VERLSVKEEGRIAELLAEGVPVWQLHQEINRSRFAIRRAVRSLLRPRAPQRQRSPLRLSLSERARGDFSRVGGGRLAASHR